MGAMTVQGLRDFVRNTLDSDSDELPDSLCDAWMNEAQNKIASAFDPWPYLEIDATWVADGNQGFDLASKGIERIDTVTGPQWPLRYIPHSTAVDKYAWSGSRSGSSVEYSLHAGSIFFWPIPPSGDTFTIVGWRPRVEAVAAADELDLPTELHLLVGEYMVARAIEKQGDDIMSSIKFQRFETELDTIRRRAQKAPEAGIQVVGGGTPAVFPFGRLKYDWE